jgi:CheY-like chemotaxis protein
VDGVEVELKLADDLPPLWADGHQLHQVVLNLATNAHHALRGVPLPRRLSISTRHDAERRQVLIEVSDNGSGIPSELRARIFEPFFTTKPMGAGTGLGLSLCQGIAKSHGGTIEVQGAGGQGTLFRIALPIESRPPSHAQPSPEPLVSANPAAGVRILLVDDEPEVRDVLAELLASEGHRVETAEDGLAALERIEQGAYDLIVSDLRMPRLDGPGLYREVVRRWPGLTRRFIFTTGDSLSPDTRLFLEEVALPHLPKPAEAGQVREVVQRALGIVGKLQTGGQ